MTKINMDEYGTWNPENKEEVEEMYDHYTAFLEVIERAASKFSEASGKGYGPDLEDCKIQMGNEMIYLHWKEYRYGGYEDKKLSFPIKILWGDNDWEEELKKETMRKNLEAIKKKKVEEEAIRKRKEKRDYETYLALKKKFKEQVDFSAKCGIIDITDKLNTSKKEGGTKND